MMLQLPEVFNVAVYSLAATSPTKDLVLSVQTPEVGAQTEGGKPAELPFNPFQFFMFDYAQASDPKTKTKFYAWKSMLRHRCCGVRLCCMCVYLFVRLCARARVRVCSCACVDFSRAYAFPPFFCSTKVGDGATRVSNLAYQNRANDAANELRGRLKNGVGMVSSDEKQVCHRGRSLLP